MPALPELGDALGEEGALEVLRHFHAKDLRRAHDRIHGAGKVHIELDGIAHRCDGDDAALVLAVVGKDCSDHQVQPVGHNELLGQAVQDAQKAGRQIVPGDRPYVPELLRCVTVAADGAFHDLGEEAHEQRQAAKVGLRWDDPTVDVNGIRYALEGEERDADGQKKMGHLHPHPSAQSGQDCVDISGKETGVFQHQQSADVKQDGQQHHLPLPLLVHQLQCLPL